MIALVAALQIASVPVAHTAVTLPSAIAIAAAKSPVIEIARDTYRLSATAVDISRVPLRPNVAGTAAVLHGGAADVGTLSENVAGVNIRQLVFDGGRVLDEIRAAQDVRDAGAGTYARSAQQLALTVGQTYYGALEARDAEALAQRIVAQDRSQEDLIRAQIEAGTASRVDLATAQIPTMQALVALAKAQGQRIATIAAFDNAMGLQADADVEPAADPQSVRPQSLIPHQPADYSAAVALALKERPDYRSAQDAVQAAQQTVRAARALSMPQISASANVGTATFPGSGSRATSDDFAGVTLTVPFYDQGNSRAQTAQAQVQLGLATAVSTQTELGVELEVRQTLAILTSARDALGQSESELLQAQEVLGDTQLQYRAGITTLSLLLNAQSSLTQAETDRLTAVYALRQAEQSYTFALGDVNLPGNISSKP